MVGRGPKMSFVLRGNPGLQAASSQEATFPGLKHLAPLYLQAVLLKMQNLRGGKKEISSSSPITHSRNWPSPSLCLSSHTSRGAIRRAS